MTLIVAHKTKTGVIMAGDGLSSVGNSSYASGTPKVFTENFRITPIGKPPTTIPVLFGHCGNLRGLDLLYDLALEVATSEYGFDIYDFTAKIKKCFKENDFIKLRESFASTEDDDILIAAHGEIYHIDPYFAVFRVVDDFFAIGAGQQYALGALRAIGPLQSSPQVKVQIAFDATSYYMKSIGGEITMIEA